MLNASSTTPNNMVVIFQQAAADGAVQLRFAEVLSAGRGAARPSYFEFHASMYRSIHSLSTLPEPSAGRKFPARLTSLQVSARRERR